MPIIFGAHYNINKYDKNNQYIQYFRVFFFNQFVSKYQFDIYCKDNLLVVYFYNYE
jgi:hypothetical protein